MSGAAADQISLSHPIQVGSLRLEHNVILSPMVGVTDAPFRRLCARGGGALQAGEMLSAQAITDKNAKTLNLLRFFTDERPVSSELMGSEPAVLAEAARIVEAQGADLIDINAGCPVPKIVKNKSGSTFLEKLDTLAQHVIWAAEFFGERNGLVRLRKLVPYYVANFPMASSFRTRANRAVTIDEWNQLIEDTREKLAEPKPK